MKITQISVFLENKNGRLAEVSKVLSDGGVNLRAATIADTADFGILRLIADDPDRATQILLDGGFTAKETDVLGIVVDDRPGGWSVILDLFEENEVNIEYLYSSLVNREGKAIVIFKVEDIDHGLAILKKNKLDAEFVL
jgi:hypothetical protein